MKQKKIIFRDQEIVDFCKATKDTNEIHNPEFMEKLGKRVIVPGMYALSTTLNIESLHLKTKVNSIKVLFNSLLSSGDFATLLTTPSHEDDSEIRLSAINHKDTLTSNDEYTRMFYSLEIQEPHFNGIARILPLEQIQLETFAKLVGAADPDVSNFLFSVAYASQALLSAIDNPETEVEREIGGLISGDSKISPFYQSLEILIPEPFPVFDTGDVMEYYIHFEREKPKKLYTAHVRCESKGVVIYHSRYKLVGIPDIIILRMAKDLNSAKAVVSENWGQEKS
jgi:hypothetical protein